VLDEFLSAVEVDRVAAGVVKDRVDAAVPLLKGSLTDTTPWP
jgi:hypothetical protein